MISRRLNCRVGVAMNSSASSSGPPNATRDSNRVRVRAPSRHARRARASRPDARGDPRAGRTRALPTATPAKEANRTDANQRSTDQNEEDRQGIEWFNDT